MIAKCGIFVIFQCVLIIKARPEPPYYYTPPLQSQTQVFNGASQSYSVPSTSYGTPVFRNTIPNLAISSPSDSSLIPSRNYGSPDLLSSNQAPSSTYIPQPQRISVQKHIYVHVAPPDVEEERQRVQEQQQISTQKHYKIIFIKAPSYQPSAQYVAQQQALQQEKTLVYVLVKKPDDVATVSAAQLAAAPISRPEVYFIKYKAKNEQGLDGGHRLQQITGFTQDNSDSVVVESADGRAASSSSSAGYNYDRPGGILK